MSRNSRFFRLNPAVQQQSLQREQQRESASQPLLARLYSRFLRFGAATLLAPFGFGQIEGLKVEVRAFSNWDVALGNIEELRIRCDRILSSPLVQTSRGFELQGRHLHLGVYPAACLLATPSLLLYVASREFRSLLRLPILLGILLWLTGAKPVTAIKVWLPQVMIDKPQEKAKRSVLTYRLALSGEDLSKKKTLLRSTIRRAMESLLRNSLVGVALSTAAAAGTASNSATSKTQEQQLSELMAAIEANESATSIELKKVTIGKFGKILLDASATFPQPTAAIASDEAPLLATIDFVVRVKVAPLEAKRFRVVSQAAVPPPTNALKLLPASSGIKSSNRKVQTPSAPPGLPDKCGIMVSDAEIKVSFDQESDSGDIVPLEIFGKPIPDLWVPLGSGAVAFPFGLRNRVTSVETQERGYAEEDRIDICGEIHASADPPPLRNGWSMPFKSMPLGDLPPPPRRPPNPSSLPSLPPSRV